MRCRLPELLGLAGSATASRLLPPRPSEAGSETSEATEGCQRRKMDGLDQRQQHGKRMVRREAGRDEKVCLNGSSEQRMPVPCDDFFFSLQTEVSNEQTTDCHMPPLSSAAQ